METERQITIYALCAPDTNEIRYIGQSANVDTRLKAHITTAFAGTAKRDIWIRSLLTNGKLPTIRALSVTSPETADAAERDAIVQARQDGKKLVNCEYNHPHSRTKREHPKREKVTISFRVSQRLAERFEKLAKMYGTKEMALLIAMDRLRE